MTSTFKGLGTVMDLLSQSNSEVFTVGNTSNTARLRLYDMNTPSSGYCISTTSNIVAKTSSLFIYKASGTGTCVGIGISSLVDTTNALYVSGNANVTGTLSADSISARALNVDSVNNANNVNLNTISSATSTNYTFLFADASLGVGRYGTVWGTTTASKTILYNSSTGNVGIGTTTFTETGGTDVMKLTVAGHVAANGGWFYVIGNQGIYWDTYKGGLYMDESTTLKVYGSKNISTAGSITATAGFSGSGANITSLNATNITSGTLARERGGTGTITYTGTAGTKLVYDTSPTISSPTFTGTVTAATVNATTLSGSGTSVTALNAANITSGTLARERGGTGTITYTGTAGTKLVYDTSPTISSPTFTGTINGLAGDGSSLTNVKVGLGLNTTTNGNRYLAFTSTSAASTGASLEIDTSLSFNPSTDTLTCPNVAVGGKFTASNLEILGSTTILKSYTQQTSNVVINNAGPGPALKVIQSGTNSIAEFWDKEQPSAPAMCITNDGFVGIGITNPSQKLDVGYGNINAGYFFGSGQYLTDVQAANVNDSTITIYTPSSGYLTGGASFTLNQGTDNTITLSANASSSPVVNTLVARDAFGSFTANTINANLVGNATISTLSVGGATTLGTLRATGALTATGTLSAGNTTLGTTSVGAFTAGTTSHGNATMGTLSAGNTTLGTLSATATTLGTIRATNTILGNLSATATTLGTLSATATSVGAFTAGTTSYGNATMGTLSAGNATLGTLSAATAFLGHCLLYTGVDNTCYFLNKSVIGNIGANHAISQNSAGRTIINSSNTQPILFYTNGDEKVRIDSEGKLGIGTNNPTAPLHVIAKAGTVGYEPETGGIYCINPTMGANQDSVICARVTGARTRGATTPCGNPYFSLDVADERGWSIGIDTADAKTLKFVSWWDFNTSASSGYTSMSITTAGNVGIGTSTPTQKLDVVGNIKCTAITGDGSGLTNITVATATTATNVSGGTGSLTSLSAGATTLSTLSAGATTLGTLSATSFGGGYIQGFIVASGTDLILNRTTNNGIISSSPVASDRKSGRALVADTSGLTINYGNDYGAIFMEGNVTVKNNGTTTTSHACTWAQTVDTGGDPFCGFDVQNVGGWSVGARNTHRPYTETVPNRHPKFQICSSYNFDSTSSVITILKSTGNVGIGSSTPTEKLDVDGSIKCSGSLSAGATTLSTLSATTINATSFTGSVTGNASSATTASALSTYLFPNAVWINSADGKNRLHFGTNDYSYYGSENGHQWRTTGDTTIMTLTSGGALKIGHTTIQSTAIYVYETNSGIKSNDSSVTYLAPGLGHRFVIGTPEDNPVTNWKFYISDTEGIKATGDITAFASDIRLKTNIQNIDDALDKIKQLSAFTYEFNDLGASFGFSSNVVHAGVSAQEVQRVFPDVVRRAPFDCDDMKPNSSKSGEEYLTVQYEKLVPLLIAGIKEEVKHREALEIKCSDLETQLAQQSARLEALEKYLKINSVS